MLFTTAQGIEIAGLEELISDSSVKTMLQLQLQSAYSFLCIACHRLERISGFRLSAKT